MNQEPLSSVVARRRWSIALGVTLFAYLLAFLISFKLRMG